MDTIPFFEFESDLSDYTAIHGWIAKNPDIGVVVEPDHLARLNGLSVRYGGLPTIVVPWFRTGQLSLDSIKVHGQIILNNIDYADVSIKQVSASEGISINKSRLTSVSFKDTSKTAGIEFSETQVMSRISLFLSGGALRLYDFDCEHELSIRGETEQAIKIDHSNVKSLAITGDFGGFRAEDSRFNSININFGKSVSSLLFRKCVVESDCSTTFSSNMVDRIFISHCVFDGIFECSNYHKYEVSKRTTVFQLHVLHSRFAGKIKTTDLDAVLVPKIQDTTFDPKGSFLGMRSSWKRWSGKRTFEATPHDCRVLREVADINQDWELAHHYYRHELRQKYPTETDIAGLIAIRAYGVLSDHGYSIIRPLVWLVAVATGAATLINSLAPKGTIWDSFQLSFSTLVPFLPSTRIARTDALEALFGRHADIPGWLHATLAVEGLLAAIMLFLFGLALRNRFKM